MYEYKYVGKNERKRKIKINLINNDMFTTVNNKN